MAKKTQEDPFTVDPKGDLQSFSWIHTWFYKAYPSLTHLPTAPSLKEPLSGTKTNLFTYLPKVARLSPATLHFFLAPKTDQQQLPSLSLSMCSISAQGSHNPQIYRLYRNQIRSAPWRVDFAHVRSWC